MELSKIEETVFMFDGGIHMHERVMRENYAKAYKLVVILAVVLAVVSAVAIPLSLSRQIRDAAALEQTYDEEHHDGEHDGHDSEDAWKSQITPLTPTHFVIFGVIAGVALSIKAIRGALQKHRSAMIWFILGLMIGSLYTIAVGPASLQTPQPPLSAASFRPLAFLLGVGLLVGLELLRRRMERGVTAA